MRRKQVEYNLKVAQKDIHAEVDIQGDRSLKVQVDKRFYDIQFNMISDNLLHMVIHNNRVAKQVSAYASKSPEGKIISINGRQYLVCDLDEEGKKIKKGSTPDLPEQITPPMPAVVVRISVQEGDSVHKGQGIIVVSAMKMETTLCAPFDGTVAKINCAVNDKVMPGQILAEINKQGDI
jgi:biotin carboxyl carrier protein